MSECLICNGTGKIKCLYPNGASYFKPCSQCSDSEPLRPNSEVEEKEESPSEFWIITFGDRKCVQGIFTEVSPGNMEAEMEKVRSLLVEQGMNMDRIYLVDVRPASKNLYDFVKKFQEKYINNKGVSSE